MSRRFCSPTLLPVFAFVICACSVSIVRAQSGGTPMSTRPEDLLKVLQSDAPKPDKAVACKLLAVYGGKEAVPAAAALLADPELASWARITLEAIPDPSADAALLDAVGKLQGRLLVGVINSIAVRRDAKAIDLLTQKLQDSNVEVATAAANALGHIGGDRAAETLERTLATASAASAAPAIRSAAAEGCVLCAEQYLAGGNAQRATALYDAVRKAADLPKQRVIEGTRGAILARGSAGIPLLVEQLRSPDKSMVYIGLRVTRELQGGDVTQALIAEFGRAEPALQSLLVVALADRGDPAVKPVLLQAARSGAPAVRLAATGLLDRLADVSAVPVLVEAAASNDAELAQAARASLARLPGKDVDSEVLARLRESSGRNRQVLIELAEQRKLEGALPIFMKSAAEDADAGVRTAAIEAVGAIGTDKQLPDLLRLLTKATDAADRRVLERAVSSIGGRWGAASVPHLAPLAKGTGDRVTPETRIVALHALAACGGPEALAGLRSALEDKDAAVQDEAVRTLSTWPNRWPEDGSVADPLLNLAKSASKQAHRVLGVRGFIQYVQGDKKPSAEQRLARVDAILPLATRAEEKRLVIATLSAIGSGGALERLTALAGDPPVADEAIAAIVRLAGRPNSGIPNAQRRAALQAVVDKSKSQSVRDRAKEALKDVPNE
jgi:HEAT repeat protein